MKINVGDYVRTEISNLNLQRIGKIKKIISEDFIHTDIGTYDKEDIIKSSPNIIDLIEEMDVLKLEDVDSGEIYVSEVAEDVEGTLLVHDFSEDKLIELNLNLFLNKIKIISIVTKQQFLQMEYRINE